MRALALLALAPSVAAAAPLALTHQGRLLDSAGSPISGAADVRVTLYDTETAPAGFWTRNYAGLIVQDGYYAVALVTSDSSQPLSLGDFADGEVWVGVEVGTTAVGPRQRLQSAPFALQASSATTASTATTANGVTLPQTTGTTCSSAGTLAYQPTTQQLLLCTGTSLATVGAGGVTRTIAIASGVRTWSDGTVAASCWDYKNPPSGYAYTGATGDGVYRIQPAGAPTPFDVNCDQTTNNGGWTRFWWFTSGSSMGTTDVLGGALSACSPSAATCFARIPVASPTAMLVSNSAGRWGAWTFDSGNDTSNRAKGAFVNKTQVATGSACGANWNPTAHSTGFSDVPYRCDENNNDGNGCRCFYYTTQGGILSFDLDDDTGYGETAFAAGNDGSGGVGVDSLEISGAYPQNGTSQSLWLYYR
jgi:hypothetical protein